MTFAQNYRLPAWTLEELWRAGKIWKKRFPGKAEVLARRLGPLAPLLLEDPILQEAFGTKPRLGRNLEPGFDGGCFFALVCWEKGEKLPSPPFRSCFPLPLLWRQAKEEDPFLPEGFHRASRRVKEALGVEGWSLGLGIQGPARPKLSGLSMKADSAWAILGAGLLLALEGKSPDRSVLASACWDDGRGPMPVGRLEEKLSLAEIMGCREFFVSPADQARAEEWGARKGSSIKIHALLPRIHPREALEPLLALLQIPPGKEAGLDTRIRFYSEVLASHYPRKAQAYYSEHLLDDLLARLEKREKDKKETREFRGQALVTTLSTNPEVALFAVQALRPSKCLVLTTKESNPQKDASCRKVLQRIRSLTRPGEVVVRQLSPPFHESAAKAASEFAGDLGGSPLVVDVTPGPKQIALALLAALGDYPSHPVYLDQTWQGRSRKPGGEKLIWIKPYSPVEPSCRKPGTPKRARASWTDPAKVLLEPLQPRLVRMELEPGSRLKVPKNMGGLLRRALGPALKDLVCKEEERLECEGCQYIESCTYALLYESPSSVIKDPSRTNSPFTQRLMILRALPGRRRVIHVGMRFLLEILFFGAMRGAAGQVVLALMETGRRGIGADRVPFEIKKAALVNKDGKEIPLLLDKNLRHIPDGGDRIPVFPPTTPTPERARLRILTRARIVSGGALVSRLPFEVLIRAILRRYTSLYEICRGKPLDWNFGEILASASEVGTLEENFFFSDNAYWSTRQAREVPEGGLLGKALYVGRLGKFIGLLQAGEVLHIGKGTVSGHGRIKIDFF